LAELGSSELKAKIEWMNPSGSVKDRAAYWTVREAQEFLLLNPRKVIIEPSSGNMGIALASAAEGLGLKVEMVIPEMKSLMEKKAYNGLFDNSYSPASRPSRGEL
jgi:cysteine synthase B